MRTKYKKPPLGLTPRYINDLQRIEDIKCAIERYICAGMNINIEWIVEYNELIKKYYGRE